jgi:hypothetical protein
MGWASNGADSGTAGYGYHLEGIEIKIVEKGATAPGATENAFQDANAVVETPIVEEGNYKVAEADFSNATIICDRDGIKIGLVTERGSGNVV